MSHSETLAEYVVRLRRNAEQELRGAEAQTGPAQLSEWLLPAVMCLVLLMADSLLHSDPLTQRYQLLLRIAGVALVAALTFRAIRSGPPDYGQIVDDALAEIQTNLRDHGLLVLLLAPGGSQHLPASDLPAWLGPLFAPSAAQQESARGRIQLLLDNYLSICDHRQLPTTAARRAQRMIPAGRGTSPLRALVTVQVASSLSLDPDVGPHLAVLHPPPD